MIEVCLTRDDGPGKHGVECHFPFIYEGSYSKEGTFAECPYEEGGGVHWCATEVDSAGKYVVHSGNWGFCNDDYCPREGMKQSTIFMRSVFQGTAAMHLPTP